MGRLGPQGRDIQMNASNAPVVVNQMMYMAVRSRLADIAGELAQLTGWTVQSGPFQSMILPQDASWGSDGLLAPKVLGCYEAELHPAIERAIERQPEVVINVGCAEGFYAIGLARRLPEARVFAFDIDEAAHRVCLGAAAQNGVADRLQVAGLCEPQHLRDLVRGARRALIVMDCEGGERALLDAAVMGDLANADILVECHDFVDRAITPTLLPLLSEGREAAVVREGARDPASFPVLQRLGSLERWLTVCEFRPEVMSWLVSWAAAEAASETPERGQGKRRAA
jgi:hypothetical protein